MKTTINTNITGWKMERGRADDDDNNNNNNNNDEGDER